MVTHVVLMKFKPEGKAENMARAQELLLSLLGEVDALLELEVGLNVVPSARAYDLSLITRFDSLRSLEEYADHPEHVKVKTFLSGVLEASIVVDSEEP